MSALPKFASDNRELASQELLTDLLTFPHGKQNFHIANTEIALTANLFENNGLLNVKPAIAPRRHSVSTFELTSSHNNNQSLDAEVSRNQSQDKNFYALCPLAKLPPLAQQNSSILQLWEGEVLEVDWDRRTIEVLLNSKIGNLQPHTGEIELQWVSEQDIDLVVPGAVFYLTLFKRTKRGSIENAQELRFRRLPSWTRQQVSRIKTEAEVILSKIKEKPIAE
jgi:hypothetical protein